MLPENPPELVETVVANDTTKMEIVSKIQDDSNHHIPCKQVPEIKTEFDEIQSNLTNIIKALDEVQLVEPPPSSSTTNVPPKSSSHHDDNDDLELESLPDCDPELCEHDEYTGNISASIIDQNQLEIVCISEKKFASNSPSSPVEDSSDILKPPLIIEVTTEKDGDVSPEPKPVIETDSVVRTTETIIPKPRERKSKLFNKNDISTAIEEKSDNLPKEDARRSVSPDPKQSDPPPPPTTKVLSIASSSSDKKSQKKDYPVDLNPFGDDDNNHDDAGKHPTESKPKMDSNKTKPTVRIEYPDDLNPFGDDDGENVKDNSKQLNTTTSSSLNPFGSESEDETVGKNLSVTPPPRRAANQQSTPSSTPTRRKKKKAPLPPNKSNQSLNKLDQQTETNNNNHMFDSRISNTSSMVDLTGSTEQLQPSSSRTPTPTPRRSKINKSISSTNLVVVVGDQQESSTSNSSNSVQAQLKAIKNKKRPAPPRPALKRSLKTSTEDMDQELEAISQELPSVEQERAELEKWLLDHKNNGGGEIEAENGNEKESPRKTDDNNDDYERKLDRFLELARQKCKLGRRQKELMYMKRELKLEETQLEFEYQLRIIMSKQDTQKTDEDRSEEQRLLGKMMEIIDERNDIIENMVQDENKEIEEYQKMISQVVGLEKSPENEQPQHSNQTANPGGETADKSSSSSSSSKTTLKPFSRLKKLNKKFQAKIKSQPFDKDDDVAGQPKAENQNMMVVEDDKSSTNSEDTGRGSPTPNDSTTKINGNHDTMKPKSNHKKQNLATLGRSTLKKLTRQTKTLQTAAKDIKSKFNHQPQQQQPQQPVDRQDGSSPSPLPDVPVDQSSTKSASISSAEITTTTTIQQNDDDKPKE